MALVTFWSVLALSLALNLGLLLRFSQEPPHYRDGLNEVHHAQRTRLAVSHAAFPSETEAADDNDRVINLDHLYGLFVGFSYPGSVCGFLEPELAKQVVRLHKAVGNVVTENRRIVEGTGSTQTYQAVLYALGPRSTPLRRG